MIRNTSVTTPRWNNLISKLLLTDSTEIKFRTPYFTTLTDRVTTRYNYESDTTDNFNINLPFDTRS